jgi:hypothetical protein
VEVFALVGASAVRRRLQAAAARGLTRFVGRQQELMALQQALERAGAGHGQMVAVVGEAGVGKSRLVYEFILPIRSINSLSSAFQAAERDEYPTPAVAEWLPALLTRTSTAAGVPRRSHTG